MEAAGVLRIRSPAGINQEPVPRFDEVPQVAAQHQSLHQPAERPEGGLELDTVHHDRSRRIPSELMNVPEPPERSFDLLVDEEVRNFHRGDAARHPERDAEVPGPSGDVFPQGNQALRHSRDRLFPGASCLMCVGDTTGPKRSVLSCIARYAVQHAS